MTVRKRTWKNKDGITSECWMVDITYNHPDGRTSRIRKTAPGTTKRDAEAYERQIVSALITETYQTRKDAPLYKDFYEEWERNHARVHLKPSTLINYRNMAKAHLLPTYSNFKLDEITSKEIASYQAKLLNGNRKNLTVNTIIQLLTSQLSIAVSWGIIDEVPKVKRLKKTSKEIDFFDFDEADRLIAAAADEPELQALIVVALKTGMRIGELMALRWSDIDLIKKVLTVQRNSYMGHVMDTPKGGKSREIPLSDLVVEALAAQRLRSALRGEYVFSTPEGGLNNYRLKYGTMPRLCRKAGLRELRWHALRHTFASHLVMLNVPLKVVQDLLGHTTMDMTLRYAHLAPATLNASVQLLDSREVFGTREAQKEMTQRLSVVKA